MVVSIQRAELSFFSYLVAILGNILPFLLVTHGGLPACLQLNDLLDRLS